MSEQGYFNVIAGLIALTVVVGGAVAIVGEGHAGSNAPAAVISSAPVHLYLTIAFQAQTGNDQYYPANFTVPQGVAVIVTIESFDNGTNVVPNSAAAVTGTVGGVATIVNGYGGTPTQVRQVPLNGIAHTFTVSNSAYNLNVPVPTAPSMVSPVFVTFTAYFNTTGAFQWVCLAPCDPGSMEAPGFMSGTLTVE